VCALTTQAALPPAALALSRAPLYIRLQARTPAAEAALRAELAALRVSIYPVAAVPGAWELRSSSDDDGAASADVDLTAMASFAAGAFEVQDLGSQALLAAVSPPRGGAWLDACAGAGGKSLQLAALLGPSGRVHAADVRADALKEVRRRAKRAGLERVITTLPAAPDTSLCTTELYDGVLVDAPCTGSGTWRRAPHLRWQLTPGGVAAAAALQLRILRGAAWRVRPGGLLIYATCSLADAENGGVVDAFLTECAAAKGGSPFEAAELPGAAALGVQAAGGRMTLPPAALNTDGFFVAALRRTR
jgi:16S rRNA (cytosine967-C5)-methyltransferase